METVRSVFSILQQGDWMPTIDLKDAYLHVQVLPAHRFLRVAVEVNAIGHLQFSRLPFTLSSSPTVFTEIIVALVAELMMKGIFIIP